MLHFCTNSRMFVHVLTACAWTTSPCLGSCCDLSVAQIVWSLWSLEQLGTRWCDELFCGDFDHMLASPFVVRLGCSAGKDGRQHRRAANFVIRMPRALCALSARTCQRPYLCELRQ